jgi:hypothetical protein
MNYDLERVQGRQSEDDSAILDALIQNVERLPIDQKAILAARLLGQPSDSSFLLEGDLVVKSSLELSGTVEELSEKLREISPQAFDKLLKAIALRMASASAR